MWFGDDGTKAVVPGRWLEVVGCFCVTHFCLLPFPAWTLLCIEQNVLLSDDRSVFWVFLSFFPPSFLFLKNDTPSHTVCVVFHCFLSFFAKLKLIAHQQRNTFSVVSPLCDCCCNSLLFVVCCLLVVVYLFHDFTEQAFLGFPFVFEIANKLWLPEKVN